MIARWSAARALAATTFAFGALQAQAVDTIPVVRHMLAIDYARVRPFHRSYDMVVITRDSTVPVGRRDVSFTESVAADSSNVWTLVETRSGLVSSTDSIFLDQGLRPMRWHSVVGFATLDMAFSADSSSGTITLGKATSRLTSAIPPDVILSSAATELFAALLPLAPSWSDSASALSLDMGSAKIEATELAVSREDSVAVPQGSSPRACWLLTLRSAGRESRMWVDRSTGDVVLAQTQLPAHVGVLLEYRMRPEATQAP